MNTVHQRLVMPLDYLPGTTVRQETSRDACLMYDTRYHTPRAALNDKEGADALVSGGVGKDLIDTFHRCVVECW